MHLLLFHILLWHPLCLTVFVSIKLFLETQNYPYCSHLSLGSLHFFFAIASHYFSSPLSNVHTSQPCKLKQEKMGGSFAFGIWEGVGLGGLMEIKEREEFVCFGELNLGMGGWSLNNFDNSMGSQFGFEFEQDGLYWF